MLQIYRDVFQWLGKLFLRQLIGVRIPTSLPEFLKKKKRKTCVRIALPDKSKNELNIISTDFIFGYFGKTREVFKVKHLKVHVSSRG